MKVLGGGTEDQYMVGGHLVSFLVPPASFDPSTASNSRLHEYGFPERPANATTRARWMNAMTRWKGSATAPPFLVETLATASSEDSPYWAGYVLKGNNGAYHSAQAW